LKNNTDNTEMQTRMDRIPDHLFVKCPVCGNAFYNKKLGQYKLCPNCKYGFRLTAEERIALITDAFTPMDTELTAPKRFLTDDRYADKLAKAKSLTKLNESVQTGIAQIGNQRLALGVMDARFIMGSLGTATGEKLARLFEKATEQGLPVVIFSCSGGARMQEGIHSLMQMAKVSQAVSDHSEAGLLYISVLTDPTTGGVTASYAMQGDINLSEPHTLIGFAGRRVIEKTIQQRPPKDFQRAETLLKNGFLDAIVQRDQMKSTLAKLLAWN
jgi:acetyl-CoA carboxylase carboxyl transferase subunit beta